MLSIEPGKPWTRINWNLMADRWMSTMKRWMSGDRNVLKITPENAGKLVRLRVEEQKILSHATKQRHSIRIEYSIPATRGFDIAPGVV
ncbi:hypothetical protein RCO48_35495 [Peribacillus frigoritolerans]|nr:hypothetical protein [Peribacillus frigoritolerans]